MSQFPQPESGPLAPGQRLPRSNKKELSPNALEKIRRMAEAYPDPMGATLPALYLAQSEFGFLSLEAMKAVAKALGIPESHVFGVATFYTLFQKHPVGRYHLQVCTNLSCTLRGAAEVLKTLCEATDCRPNEGPSSDGLFSLEEVECLASCGSAPCVQVNHEVYEEFLDPPKALALVEACRRGEFAPWGD